MFLNNLQAKSRPWLQVDSDGLPLINVSAKLLRTINVKRNIQLNVKVSAERK